jgi:hypothetical protein
MLSGLRRQYKPINSVPEAVKSQLLEGISALPFGDLRGTWTAVPSGRFESDPR